jgi:cytochrome c oxidase subunit 4
MSNHAEEMDRHIRTYLFVFGSLIVLTLLTVASWKFLELPIGPHIAVALIIATIKATLVACFFMHLISERKLIMGILGLTVFFFFMLLLLPTMTSLGDQVGH